MTKKGRIPKRRNPVAKNAPDFCKSTAFRNRKKDYTRKQKYEGFELDHPKHQPYDRYKVDKQLKDEYEEPSEDGEEDQGPDYEDWTEEK